MQVLTAAVAGHVGKVFIFHYIVYIHGFSKCTCVQCSCHHHIYGCIVGRTHHHVNFIQFDRIRIPVIFVLNHNDLTVMYPALYREWTICHDVLCFGTIAFSCCLNFFLFHRHKAYRCKFQSLYRTHGCDLQSLLVYGFHSHILCSTFSVGKFLGAFNEVAYICFIQSTAGVYHTKNRIAEIFCRQRSSVCPFALS